MPPRITLPHQVTVGSGLLTIYPRVHRPFMSLMGRLYPKFAGYDKAEKGYSGFVGGSFIGCCAGLTLQSVRKNPWLQDDNQWFMRFLLGSIHISGHDRHTSVCSADNYGTLRLWQGLGLGAKLDARGKARTAPLSTDSGNLLQTLIDDCKAAYTPLRQRASREISSLSPLDRSSAIPTHTTFADLTSVSVEVSFL